MLRCFFLFYYSKCLCYRKSFVSFFLSRKSSKEGKLEALFRGAVMSTRSLLLSTRQTIQIQATPISSSSSVAVGFVLYSNLEDSKQTRLNLRSSTGIALTQIQKYSSSQGLFFVVVKKQATQDELKEILQGANEQNPQPKS